MADLGADQSPSSDMNKGTFFPNGVFLVLLAKETFDVVGANADVAADDRRATAAASKNFIVMIEFYFAWRRNR
jgi:hypothetical protein